MTPRAWTLEEKRRLVRVWGNPLIARGDIPWMFKRTPGSIDSKIREMGLGPRDNAASHRWTEPEANKLRELWLVTPMAELSRKMGRTEKSCSSQAHKMGLPSRKGGTYREPKHQNKPPEVYIRRRCLCCDNTFDAETKFLRMCPPCRKAA